MNDGVYYIFMCRYYQENNTITLHQMEPIVVMFILQMYLDVHLLWRKIPGEIFFMAEI